MTAGAVTLTPLPQADGRLKHRPAILLRRMPPFGDWLICGVSTQLRQEVPGFDDIIEPSHPDFRLSGLKAASLIRLGFLTVLPATHFAGVLGHIASERHAKLLQRLAALFAIAPLPARRQELIRERIREVARREAGLADSVAGDVAFHMADWLDELDAYSLFCANPGMLSDAEDSQLLISFLVHVPNHVAAAGKLYTNVAVTDIFGVGATSEDTSEAS